MRCAILLDKLVHRGDVTVWDYLPHYVCDYPQYSISHDENTACRTTRKESCFLPAGTYTVDTRDHTAGLTCRVYTYDGGVAAGQFPSASAQPAAMPYTFTIDGTREVIFSYGKGTGWTESFTADNIYVHDVNGTAEPSYETVAIAPEEMISGSVTEALNAKGNVTVTISPFSEAFGFASRTTTFVRVIDLDRSANREILRGRVSAITDSMDSNGKIQQEITCVSALDFLEDTGLATISDGALLQTWLSNVIAGHNGAVEANRQLTLSYTGSNEACIYGADSIAGNSRYNVISQILTSGSYLSTARSGQAVPGYTYEFRERYENDTSYIDVARKFSTDKDTAFVIGENLQSIRVEQTTDGGIYNAVVAVSGVNSDGSRESYTAYNAEMRAQYPGTYSLIVRNDSIRCTAAMYDDQRQWTEAHTAMWNALRPSRRL